MLEKIYGHHFVMLLFSAMSHLFPEVKERDDYQKSKSHGEVKS